MIRRIEPFFASLRTASGRCRARWFPLGWVLLIVWVVIPPAPPPAFAQQPAERGSTQQREEEPRSREERLRRQRELIQQRLEQRRQRLEQERRQREADRQNQPRQARQPEPAQPVSEVSPTTASQPAPPPADLGLDVSGKGRVPHATFYLSPASISARSGQRFATDARLINPDHQAFDTMNLVLHYPPDHLRPTAVHQAALKPHLAGEPRCAIDHRHGILHYQARLKQPRDGLSIDLLTIEWEALEPIHEGWIRPSYADRTTSFLHGDRDITWSSLGASGGKIGARFRIAPAETPGASRRPELSELSVGDGARMRGLDRAHMHPPTFWIDQPATGTLLEPGHWRVIDVGLFNPRGAMFDEVRLALRYDPQKVWVCDTDHGNWITTGHNILDGPFHELWPWRHHYVNRVDPRRGLIDYRMGTSSLRRQPSGPLARIVVRIREVTRAPILEWVWRPGTASPSSGVYLLGRNLLEQPREAREAPAFPVAGPGEPPPSDLFGVEKAKPSWYQF